MVGLNSLITEQDHELVIRALEFYIECNDLEHSEKMEVYTLLNWIKLQLAKSRYKHKPSK